MSLNKSDEGSTTLKSVSAEGSISVKPKTMNFQATPLSADHHSQLLSHQYLTNITATKHKHAEEASVQPFLTSTLGKYWPKTKNSYIDRFCVASSTGFLCYRNEWCAFSPTYKPLIEVPYSAIEKVEKYIFYKELE
jgi:hypothetical protein